MNKRKASEIFEQEIKKIRHPIPFNRIRRYQGNCPKHRQCCSPPLWPRRYARMPVSYVGLDLDGIDPLPMLISYFNAKNMFPNSRIEVRRTLHGYHIRVNEKLSVENDLLARAYLGDDQRRLEHSEDHARWLWPDRKIDVLYDRKYDSRKVKGYKERQYTKVISPVTGSECLNPNESRIDRSQRENLRY